jgi:glutathione S-transferase
MERATLALGAVAAAGLAAGAAWLARSRSRAPAPSKTLRVYGFLPIGVDADSSPPCVKLLAFLRLAKLLYDYVPWPQHQMRGAPKGKVPFVSGELVGPCPLGDSQLIIETVQARGVGADMDAAIGTAFRVMLDESLYWGNVSMRWSERGISTTAATYFATLPALVRLVLTRSVQRQITSALHMQGLGRHSEAEMVRLMSAQWEAVATFLGSKRYFFGDNPSTVDSALVGALTGALQGEWEHPLRDAVRSHANLVAYLERMRAELFPELQSNSS